MSVEEYGPEYGGGFDAQPWHDAEILELVVDRRTPGARDEVRLLVRWPNDEVSVVTFGKCYEATFELRFGMIALETIRRADEDHDWDGRAALIARWAWLPSAAVDQLRRYELETNTTASVLRMYALGWSMQPAKDPDE